MSHSRGAVLEKVKRYPGCFLRLDEWFQSDPDICRATLLAFGNDQYSHHNPRILERIFLSLPNFSDHKDTFDRCLKSGDSEAIGKYVSRFGPEIYGNRDFLTRAISHDHLACLFKCLPLALRSDPELLELAIENVHDTSVSKLVSTIPVEALEVNEFILFRALEKSSIPFDRHEVPGSFWHNQAFIIKWIEKERDVRISCIPKEFSNDKEVCLSLCRSQSARYGFASTVKWISKDFLADKEFVLECLSHHPKIFESCAKELQNDFDVLLQASSSAVRFKTFPTFVGLIGESLVSFAQQIRIKIQAHDEFMSFLACTWRSRQILHPPLNALDCGDETAIGLKRVVGNYLGFPSQEKLTPLKLVWDEIVLLVVQRGTPSAASTTPVPQVHVQRGPLSPALMPLIPSKELAHAVLKTIESFDPVLLQSFPDELWTHRKFVEWAAVKGKFHEPMSKEFSSDNDICFGFYKHCTTARDKVAMWISDILKADQSFVSKCASVDPLILHYCSNEDIRNDFEVLLKAVKRAISGDQLDDLAQSALNNGWGDSLVVFAKLLRVKVQSQWALEAFADKAKPFFSAQKHGHKALFSTRRMVGNFLDNIPDTSDADELERVLNNRSIFFLALGGGVHELCKANAFRPRKQKHELHKRAYSDDDEDDDDYDDDYVTYDHDYYDDDDDDYRSRFY